MGERIELLSLDEESRTESLDLVAYLVTQGHRLVGIEGPPQRLVFVLGGVPAAEVEAFEDGSAVVSARKFAETRSSLFALVRARREEARRLQRLEPA